MGLTAVPISILCLPACSRSDWAKQVPIGIDNARVSASEIRSTVLIKSSSKVIRLTKTLNEFGLRVCRASRRRRQLDPRAEVSQEQSCHIADDFLSRYGASTLQQALVRLRQRRC